MIKNLSFILVGVILLGIHSCQKAPENVKGVNAVGSEIKVAQTIQLPGLIFSRGGE